jgi:hypothetical protein
VFYKIVAAVLPALFLVACGYVGPVVPPSPQLPAAVTNLTAVERGDQIVIQFSTPPRTTDNLPIRQFSDIDLRIGPSVTPFDFDRWAASAKQIPVPDPPPDKDDDPVPHPITGTVPVAEWQGQHVDILVRTAGKKRGHLSQWSNRVSLDVIEPLSPPDVKQEATAQGYRLTWQEERPGLHYQVSRQGPADKAPVVFATVDKSEYVDGTAQWDTRYVYTVTAQASSAESLPSKPVRVNHPDTFGPSVPASITALAGPDSIEISWSRSPEPDLKGYFLYRSLNGTDWEKAGSLLTLPTYSDHKVEHGKVYRYSVSAVDQKNNESGRSPIAEVAF